MTAFTALTINPAKIGEVGEIVVGTGTFTLTGALANTDTITFTGIVSPGNFRVIGFDIWSNEIDTDATPTGTWTVGNATDPDGYLTTQNMGLPAQLPANGSQLRYSGNGALIGTNIGTVSTDGNVVVTVTAAVATSATTGAVNVRIWVQGVI